MKRTSVGVDKPRSRVMLRASTFTGQWTHPAFGAARMPNFSEKVSFIWSVADLLRGPYKPNQYGKVILPLTVLRRLDCLLEPTRQAVLDKMADMKRKGTPIKNVEPILNRAAA